jgi:hypothetical protein
MAFGEFAGAMDSVVGDLERMAKGLRDGRGGAREAGVRDLSRLVEVGVEGLVGLIDKLVKEGSRSLDVHDLLERGAYRGIAIHRGSADRKAPRLRQRS